jgi:hypothetical protein
MPRTGWTPSIVPKGDDQNVYLVVDDLGRNGRVYREADVETADLETVILDLKLQPDFLTSHVQKAFPVRSQETKGRMAAALREAGLPE